MPTTPTLGIIGGSGLYNMAGLSDTEEHNLDTPWGKPSDPLVSGTLAGQRVARRLAASEGRVAWDSWSPVGGDITGLGVDLVASATDFLMSD
jgi:hypothetical protein